MFVGRSEELIKFQQRYESTKAELIFLYGRRRVGKTEFLRQFVKDKTHVLFYSATESSDYEQRERFKAKLQQAGFIDNAEWLNTWENIFSALKCEKQRRVVVIDEFPYMFFGNKGIASILQNLWDEELAHANLMLILCGSAMSFIENEILGAKNPLYGRGTAIFKMKELPFSDAKKMFPHYTLEEQMQTHMILGGIPFYLKQFNENKNLAENIKENILSPETILYNEVEFLMKQELRETAIYNSIVAAVALGNTQLNDIYQKTQIDKAKITTYLKNLIDLRIIEKEQSISATIKNTANIQRGIYQISDNFFRFWYRYVYPYRSEIESGFDAGLYENIIKKDLNEFFGPTFEKIAKELLWQQNILGELPFRFNRCGRYWEKGLEIDLVAIGEEDILFCECKWRNQPIDVNTYHRLVEKTKNSKLALKDKKLWYGLFSKSGFTKKLTNITQETKNLLLFNP